MNTKVLAVFLVFCVLAVQATGPYCALCTNIIAGVQKDYNNDFTNVSADDLEKDIDKQCDAQVTNSLEDAICKQLAAQDKTQLLAALKAGKSAHECCAEGGAC